MEQLKSRLQRLYSDASKHARYQNIPKFVCDELGYKETIKEEWRGDTARYEYIRNTIDFSGKDIVDIGANTGFFTLSLAYEYKDSLFTAIEGNQNHSKFICMVIDGFGLKNVQVNDYYVTYKNVGSIGSYDLALLFNVLHHAGVDFDNEYVSMPQKLENYIKKYVLQLRKCAAEVVFQMGYNWGGNKKKPVVPLEKDAEKVIYTGKIFTASGWVIKSIATAYKVEEKKKIVYKNIPSEIVEMLNKQENDRSILSIINENLYEEMNQLSEFYRRPIFILRRSGDS